MENRTTLACKLLQDNSVTTTAIDDVENERLGLLLDQIYGPLYSGKTTVNIVINPSGQQGKNFSVTNETLYFYYNDKADMLGKQFRNENPDKRDFMNGAKGESNNYLRYTGKNCFYPIYIKDNKIIGFGDVCDDDFHPGSSNVKLENGIIAVYPIDNDGVERKWLVQRDEIENKIIADLSNPKNGDRQLVVKEVNGIIKIDQYKYSINYKTVWHDSKYSAKEYGTNMLSDIFGKTMFTFPKSLYAVIDCIKIANCKNDDIVLDYFAGSGTTAHAVININREDSGNRKYILVEMGEYFDTVTKPRIEKVMYSENWKDGKPVSRKGSSHAFKYLCLESYEDTLNNIVLRGGQYDMLGNAREGYLLSYMLDAEAEGSACLLNIDKLDKPFDYKMNIARNLESSEHSVDLVETFNYLIGLTVVRSHALTAFDAEFTTGEYGAVSAVLKNGSTYKFKSVEGTLPNGDKALVIWREMTGNTVKDNAVLDAYFRQTFTDARSYKKIFVNCDNNLQNLRTENENWRVILIDEEMKKRIFEYSE
jgi:adenine-specific DNA-methyltransferase